MLPVLLGDGPGIGQPGAPREVFPRALQFRLPERNVRAECIRVGEELAHRVNSCLGERGLGLGEGGLAVGPVEIDDRIARADERRLVGVDADDDAGDLGVSWTRSPCT